MPSTFDPVGGRRVRPISSIRVRLREDLAAAAMAIGDDIPSAADAERLRGYSSRRSDRIYRNTQFS